MTETQDYPSRDIVFEWGRHASAELLATSDAQDTKSMAVFAAASLIVGVSTAVASVAEGVRSDGTLTFLGLALLAFAFVSWHSFQALRVQRFRGADDPRILKRDFWPLPPDEAKAVYWEFQEHNYEQNLRHVEDKSRRLRLLVPGLFIEIAFLVTWLLLVAFT